MPSIYGSCVVDVPKPVCDPCLSDAELGGIRAIAFIHSDAIAQVLANASNAAVWQMFVDSGLIFIIPETRGTFNGGDVVTRPGFGSKATINTGFDFTLEYDDPSYKSNCAFYNQLGQSNAYHVAFLTETQVKVSSKPVGIAATAPITDNINDQAVWHVIVDWSDKLQPCPFDAPQDVFVCVDTESLYPTYIAGFISVGGVLGDETTLFTGNLVDDCANWIKGTIANLAIIGATTEVISKNGGDVAFLVSQPYDAAPAILPTAAEMRIFGTEHYYGSQGTVQSPHVNSAGECGIIGDNVTTLDASSPCGCPGAISNFNSYMEQNRNFPYLLPDKIYYFGVYAKGDRMAGAYGPELLQIKLPEAAPKDGVNPCETVANGGGLVYIAQFIPASVPWPNP